MGLSAGHAKQASSIAVLGLVVIALTGCARPGPFGIVFISGQGSDREIYRILSDGTGLERLTNNDYAEWTAEVSPDGSKILFDRSADGMGRQMCMLDVDSGDISQLIDDHAPMVNVAGDWSPDRTQVALLNDRGGVYWLYLMNPDGSNLRHVPLSTDPARDVVHVSWAPDGQRMVYGTAEHIHAPQALTPTLFIVDLSTLESAQLTNGEEHGACSQPDWSWDGEWIAMVCTRGISAGDHGQVYIIRPDGTDFQQATTRPGDYEPDVRPDTSLTWVMDPNWSPDGKEIVYRASVDGPWNIYIIGSDGQNNRRLTEHDVADWSLSVYQAP